MKKILFINMCGHGHVNPTRVHAEIQVKNSNMME